MPLLPDSVSCWSHSAMGATSCQKDSDNAFIYPCQLSVHVLQSAWCAGPVCSIHIDHACWSGSARFIVPVLSIIMCVVFVIFCGLRLCYAQTHSDDCSMSCTFTRSDSPHNVVHSSSGVVRVWELPVPEGPTLKGDLGAWLPRKFWYFRCILELLRHLSWQSH